LKLSLIAALADNRVIGRGGGLPWHLPDDLRRFKSLTMGRPILMGRRTFDSIGRALPGRRNLVLTRHPDTLPAGVEAVASLPSALAMCADAEELCVIGGAELYRLALPLATRLELTQVHATIDGDVLFPDYDSAQWRELERREHAADERHRWPMTFLTLERVGKVKNDQNIERAGHSC
jgi:dihydrofolate reductase